MVLEKTFVWPLYLEYVCKHYMIDGGALEVEFSKQQWFDLLIQVWGLFPLSKPNTLKQNISYKDLDQNASKN